MSRTQSYVAFALSMGCFVVGCSTPASIDAAPDTSDVAAADSTTTNDVPASDVLDSASIDVVDASPPLDAPTTDVSYDTWEGQLFAHEHRGVIGLSILPDDDGGLQSLVNVMMISQTPPPVAGVETCASQSAEGECATSIACNTASPVDAGAPGPTRIVSAGDVSITDGTGSPWVLMPTTDSFGHVVYNGGVRSGAIWHTGDTITIDAPGADAPAFHFVRDFPPRLALTTPVLPASGRYTLPRSSDLAVAWSETGPGEVVVTVQQASSRGLSRVECRFPASRGTGTVPHAMLSLLDPTDATTNDNLLVEVTNSFQPIVGDWYMGVYVSTGGASSPLTIE